VILELGTTPVVPQIRKWLRGVDLNHRPLGYEPNELPDCSTPQKNHISVVEQGQTGSRA
jgi:hypothetical protein